MYRLICQYYYPLKNRPFGTITIGTSTFTLCVLCFLLLGLIFEPVQPYAIAISIGNALLLLTLLVALLANLRAKLNDVQYAISLEAALRRAGYEPQDFFLDEAAANPSLQLLHFKVLEFCHPNKTLELGSGQTSKLLSCYKRKYPCAYVLTLEQDKRWAQQLAPQIDHDYRQVDLERKEISFSCARLQVATDWYKDLPELHAHKFDYVLIDGPDHGGRGTDHVDYSRCGILQYFPDILSPDFVVVFDDAERYGETMTIKVLDAILKTSGIKFVRFARHGVKTQVVFCSPTFAFLQSV